MDSTSPADQPGQPQAVAASTDAAPIPAPAPTPAALSPQERIAASLNEAMRPAAPLEEVLPPEIREIRNSTARRMFPSNVMYRSAGIETLFEGAQNSADETRRHQEIAADLELSTSETTSFVRLVADARRSPPDDATIEAWGNDAMARLKLQHGDRADALLADARKLVARDPRVRDLLQQSGLGSKYEVISVFVAKASAMKAQGRLR